MQTPDDNARVIILLLTCVGFLISPFRCDSFAADFSPAQIEFFEKRVRPVLVERCYHCHSADAEKLRAGLRLDSRAGLLQGGDSGAAIVPGSAEESLLVEAIRYESLEMPPQSKLEPDDISALVEWIDDGAAWPTEKLHADKGSAREAQASASAFDWKQRQAQHWAWQPIGPMEPPSPTFDNLSTTEIDRFVAVRLAAAGLTPAASADRRTLIRRLYFDLIGLPPTPKQMEAFVNSEDEQASYRQLIDDLLDSPHFGEKWARHWLDLMRYAETFGHEFDYEIAHAHQYRDYVIRALNADVPYDEFVREHFAGDLMHPPRLHPQRGTNESIIATGFWFLGEATHAPTNVAEDEAKRIENQIDVISKAVLGLSVSCAQCHDHKFDPISTEDYYAFSGMMKSFRLHVAHLLPVDQLAGVMHALRQIDTKGQALLDNAVRSSQLTAEEVERFLLETPFQDSLTASHPLAVWQAACAAAKNSEAAQALPADAEPREASEETDDPWIAFRELPARRARFLEGTRPLGDFADDLNGWFLSDSGFEQIGAGTWQATEDRIGLSTAAALAIGRLAPGIPGTARSPTFTLGNGHVFIRLRAKHATVRIIAHHYQLEPFNSLLFEGTRKTNEQLGEETEFTWVHLGKSLRAGDQAYLEFTVAPDGFLLIDDVRIDDGPGDEPADAPNDFIAHDLDKQMLDRQALAVRYGRYWETCRANWGTSKLTNCQVQFVDWLIEHDLIELPLALGELREQALATTAQLPQPHVVRAVAEGTPVEGQVAIRGNVSNPGTVVARRLPLAVSGESQPPITAGSGRLELVNRLLDTQNPFPARVAVNRVWHHLMGRGLVETVDDFGAMGQPPSHPALLDWLASDFVRHGWSQKRLIRQIVLSSTYRMSSTPADPEAASRIDPDNRLRHCMSIRRLPAEAIRDQMLSVAGALDTTLGGSSVPVFVSEFMDGRGKPKSGPRDGDGRRSIYIAVRRNFLPSELMAFDFPVPTTSIGRRTTSNVPAQSLAMMNDPLVSALARTWATSLCDQYPEPRHRISAMFEAATGQLPSPQQMEDCLSFLETQATPHDVDENDLQPWTDLCHVVFNLKETIYLR